MKLQTTFDLSALSPEDIAKFELKCKEMGTTPEAQLEKLIRGTVRPSPPTPITTKPRRGERKEAA